MKKKITRKNKETLRGKKRKRLAALGLACALGCAGVILYTSIENSREFLKIGSETVEKEEFQMMVKKYKTQVEREYSSDQVNQEAFWTTKTEGETPLDQAIDAALEDLREKKTISAMAKEYGIEISTDFKTLKENMEKENQRRTDGQETGEVVYGMESFTIETYYDYVYTSAEAELEERLKKESQVSEEELYSVYEKNLDYYTYETGVTALTAEGGEEQQKELEQVKSRLEEGKTREELEKEFPELVFSQVEMNSLDTKAEKSGRYETRWEIAKELQKGQVSPLFWEGDRILVLKNLDRTENGRLPYEEIKGVLKSQMETAKAREKIEKKTGEVKLDFQKEDLEKAAKEVLTKT